MLFRSQSSQFLGLIINPTFIGGSGLPIADTFLINPNMPNQENVTTSTPGQWSVAPEPSSFILMSLGGAILRIGMIGKRLKVQRSTVDHN